jgi:hypothetical protein
MHISDDNMVYCNDVFRYSSMLTYTWIIMWVYDVSDWVWLATLRLRPKSRMRRDLSSSSTFHSKFQTRIFVIRLFLCMPYVEKYLHNLLWLNNHILLLPYTKNMCQLLQGSICSNLFLIICTLLFMLQQWWSCWLLRQQNGCLYYWCIAC